MVRYSADPVVPTKAAKARATYLRVHYKHCREIAHAIKGMALKRAQVYLKNVLAYKEAIPLTKYTGGRGRHSQAKQFKTPGDLCFWPQKATKSFLDLLDNLQANCETKGLKVEDVSITHANCNQAPKMRRRTYRAHGRINAYMASPAHIELMVEEKSNEIAKAAEPIAARVSKKRAAQLRVKKVVVGGGH